MQSLGVGKLVSVDQSEPTDVVDRLLWRDATQILSRHNESDDDGQCIWCGREWHRTGGNRGTFLQHDR
jgi:hypothetical protein